MVVSSCMDWACGVSPPMRSWLSYREATLRTSRPSLLSSAVLSFPVVRVFSFHLPNCPLINLHPLDTLNVSIWDLGPAPDGSASHIAFEARTSKGNALCLGEGRAYIVKTTVLAETNPLATSFTGVKPSSEPIRPANGPKQPSTKIIGPSFKGVPILQAAPAVFWAPVIVLNLLYVALSYFVTWWWQW